MLKVLRQLNYQLPWMLLMLLITIQSGFSGNELGGALQNGLDKILHFLVFGILSWLMTRGFTNAPGTIIPKYYLWFVFLIGLSFSTLDEFHQAHTPGRFMDIWDWIADASGIIIFTWLYKKRYIKKTAN